MNIFQELKEKKDILTKDGKVDALGPYGRQKLTGQEVAQYFKKNKVKDAKIRKAVEVALDLGGAMSVAQKEIKKFFGNSVLKNKDVQKALKYANESFEMNQLVGMLHESVLNLTEKNLMPDIQKIVDTKGAAKVGGVMIDMFTASMIAQIYDKVNDQNKKKMEKAKVEMLVKIAQKMMQKMEYDPSLNEGRAMKLKDIARKYKREIEQLAKKGRSPEMGKHKVYMALYNLAWENGDINTDDPDQTDEVIDEYLDDIMGEFFAHLESVKEGFKSDAQRRAAFASGYKAKGKKGKKEDIDLDEGKMGQLLMDIQQGATAKELAKSYKIPLSVAKDFLKDYYMNKRNNRKAYESVMDSYRNMIVEKKEMNPKVIEKIAKLTDRNDHNESLLLLAKELKDREAIKLLGNIKDMHKVYGHMPKELIDLRNKVFDNLMRQSKSKYANHSDVYGAL